MKKEGTVIAYIYAFVIFLFCMPFYVWSVALEYYFNVALSAVIVFISIWHFKRITAKDVFFLLLMMYIWIYHNHKSSLVAIFVTTALMVSLVLTEHEKLAFYLDKFKTLFCALLLLSIINQILIWAHIPLPNSVIPPLNIIKTYNYSAYPFLVIANDPEFVLRFHGMYDEPGVIGSIAPVLLLIDNYNIRSKRNILLLIGGLMTISFYFIVFTAVFFLLKLKIKHVISIVILCAGLYFGLKDNAFLKETLWYRFQIEDNKVKGNNRASQEFDDAFNKFAQSDDFLWGKPFNVEEDAFWSSSYKMYIMEDGLISFIVLMVAFSIYSFFYIKDRKTYLMYLFLFISMIYQRPYIFMFMYMFILYSPIPYFHTKELKST